MTEAVGQGPLRSWPTAVPVRHQGTLCVRCPFAHQTHALALPRLLRQYVFGCLHRGTDHITFLVAVVIVTAPAFDLTNGFHDTADAMATSVATGALKPKTAVRPWSPYGIRLIVPRFH